MGNFRNNRGGDRLNRGSRGGKGNIGNRQNLAEGGNKNNFNQRRRGRGGSFNQQTNNVNLNLTLLINFIRLLPKEEIEQITENLEAEKGI